MFHVFILLSDGDVHYDAASVGVVLVNSDSTVHESADVTAGAETHACGFDCIVGIGKHIEDSGLCIERDARTCVGDADDEAVLVGAAEAEGDRALLGELASVVEQIVEQTFHGFHVGQHLKVIGQLAVEYEFKLL